MVLLMHGFPQFWYTWRHQMAALADAGWRAVAMDLRGYGASDKPPRGYSTYTGAEDAAPANCVWFDFRLAIRSSYEEVRMIRLNCAR